MKQVIMTIYINQYDFNLKKVDINNINIPIDWEDYKTLANNKFNNAILFYQNTININKFDYYNTFDKNRKAIMIFNNYIYFAVIGHFEIL